MMSLIPYSFAELTRSKASFPSAEARVNGAPILLHSFTSLEVLHTAESVLLKWKSGTALIMRGVVKKLISRSSGPTASK